MESSIHDIDFIMKEAFNEIRVSPSALVCEYCGITFSGRAKFNLHVQRHICEAPDFQLMITNAALECGYSDGVAKSMPLEVIVDMELMWRMNEGVDDMLQKFSSILQHSYHITNITRADLNYILSKTMQKVMSREKTGANNWIVGHIDEDVVSYMGGYILRHLHYSKKSTSEVRMILESLKGSVPKSFEGRDRGGLWGVNDNLKNMLLHAQNHFNENARKLELNIKAIQKDLDVQKYILVQGIQVNDCSIKLFHEICRIYLTAIAFGFTKQLNANIRMEKKKLQEKKSLRKLLKTKANNKK